jgi:hypothetical protein
MGLNASSASGCGIICVRGFVPDKRRAWSRQFLTMAIVHDRNLAKTWMLQQPDNEAMPDIAELHQSATGVRVSKVLPCEDDYIVLLDYHDASKARLEANLRRLHSDGSVVWAATTPNSNGMFTDVEWRDGRLTAWTWEGFIITVDPRTGRLLEKVFTK